MSAGSGFGNLMTIASFGYMIYSLFNQKESDRPESQEIQLNNYTRDTPIPIVYGVNRVAGTCIWMGNTRAEYIEPGGGKGIAFLAMMFMNGESQSEPYGWFYYADFALGLSEGPIIDIRRFFLNSNEMSKFWEFWEYDYELGNGSQAINSLVSESLGSSAIPWRYTANLLMSGNLGQVSYLPNIEAEIAGLLSSSEHIIEHVVVREENYTGSTFIDYYDIHRTPLHIDLDDNGNIICLLTDTWISMYDHTPKKHVTSQITPFEDWAELGTSVNKNYFTSYMGAFNLEHHDRFYSYAQITNFVKTESDIACIVYFYKAGAYGPLFKMYICNVSIETGYVTGMTYVALSSMNIQTNPNTYCYLVMSQGYMYCCYLGNNKFLIRVMYLIGAGAYSYFNWLQLEPYVYLEGIDDAACTPLFPHNSNRHIDILNYTDQSKRTNSGNRVYHFAHHFGTISSIYSFSHNGLKKLFELPIELAFSQTYSVDYDEDSRSYYWLTLMGSNCYFGKNQTVIYSWSGSTFGGSLTAHFAGTLKIFKENVWVCVESYDGSSSRLTKLFYCNKGSHDITTIFSGTNRDYCGSVFFEENNRLYMLDHYIPGVSVGQRDRIIRLDTFVEDNDPNPIKVCYDFMTNERYGLGIPAVKFDGSPTTIGTWKIESDYCDVLVDIGDGSGFTEKRFMYADALSNRKKAYDIIREILSTCRGFIYYCDGKIKVKIEKGTETVEFYFGHDEYISLTAV